MTGNKDLVCEVRHTFCMTGLLSVFRFSMQLDGYLTLKVSGWG